MGVLKNHTSHCVSGAIKNGNGDEAIEELMTVFERFSKRKNKLVFNWLVFLFTLILDLGVL